MPNGLCGKAGCDAPLASAQSSYCRPHRQEWERAYQWKKSPNGLASERRRKFRKMYGLTIEQAESILAQQGGVCAICGAVPKPWQMDHDHASGAMRGVLCRPCNSLLGMARDDTAVLLRAVSYLSAGGSGFVPAI